MNILFMSLGEFSDLSAGSVHIDVVKELSKKHEVYLVCKSEKNKSGKVGLSNEYGIHVLRVATGAIKTNNFVAKGISTLTVESQFKKAIVKEFGQVYFDWVIYTTPPITFVSPISYIKKRDGASTYLMLKDIFPQNALDIGIMKKSGVMAPLYWYFRNKEKALYRISDKIGCMSPANIEFVLKNNSFVDRGKMELFPNSIYVKDLSCDTQQRIKIRNKYGIPDDKIVFVYGGNLGKPQGIPFLIKCLNKTKDIKEAYFLIVGNGTEFESIKNYLDESKQSNAKLLKGLPKSDYDLLVSACDVGMIFLDHRFTIPNFPSRILSYMQSHLPILAVTDSNTDVGDVIVQGGFGWWCESNNESAFVTKVKEALVADIASMGNTGFRFLTDHYDVEKNCRELISNLKE